MALTPTQRPTREWPLLLLTLAVVGGVCLPLWQTFMQGQGGDNMFTSWSEDRWARLLLGPEQIACYCCFTWAGLILLSRYLEVRRQRRAFDLPLIPTEEGAKILHEDARPLQRRVDQLMEQRGPFILANMIRVALGKYASTHSSQDASETVRTQAEVEQGRMVSSMAMVHFLAWAIPAIGFLGTVRGLAGSLSMAGHSELETKEFISQATTHLNVAFDCTLISLMLSIGVMFLLHAVQREEEALVIDSHQYCLEHLVNRLYEPEPLSDEQQTPSYFARQDMDKRATQYSQATRMSS